MGGTNMNTYLFAYGTLKKGQRYHADFIGREPLFETIIAGFNLVKRTDIHYPGMIEGAGHVHGEVYEIDEQQMKHIDHLEGYPTLYSKKTIKLVDPLSKQTYQGFTFLLNDILGWEKVKCPIAHWPDPEVWYISYGSNMNEMRLRRYLEKMTMHEFPKEAKPYHLPHGIYFDKQSPTWERKGVVFLDDSKPGQAYGKAYRMSFCQFLELQKLEGWYPKIVRLGEFEGRPAVTFTQADHSHREKPSESYLSIILDGLLKTYPDIDPKTLKRYLVNAASQSA